METKLKVAKLLNTSRENLDENQQGSHLPRIETLFFKMTRPANPHAKIIWMVSMAMIAWKLSSCGDVRQTDRKLRDRGARWDGDRQSANHARGGHGQSAKQAGAYRFQTRY
jgi:hypothetical protein